MKLRVAASTAILAACLAAPASAQEHYIGEVREFAFDYCPKGWAPTDGATLQVTQNAALFSLLSTKYGGDGVRTFLLPNIVPATTAASSPAPASQQGGEARVYEHCDLDGWSLPLGLGDHRPADLRAPYGNDTVSSVRASPGWQVTLFDGANLDGESVTVVGQESCLVGRNFNDRTSSIRVTRTPAAGGGSVAGKTTSCIAVQGIFPPRN